MRQHVKVIGGGFSGLSAAYALRKAGFSVELYERQTRLGGLIDTQRTPWGMAEMAASGLQNSAAVERLAADIGVPLMPMLTKGRKRYIMRNNKARRWPLDTSETLQLLRKLAAKFSGRSAWAPRPSESVAQWGRRALGTATLDRLLAPALQGIYAGDVERMSATLVFGRYFAGSARDKSKNTKAPRSGSVAPQEGMGEIIVGLQQWLRQHDVRIRLGEVAKLDTREGQVVIATAAPAAATLVAASFPKEAAWLAQVEMLGLRPTTLFFAAGQSRHPRGFGCLFPRSEGYHALGVLYPAEIFAHRGPQHVESWIVPDDPMSSDEDVVQRVLAERARFLGQELTPVGSITHRWPQALPHYTTDLEMLLQSGLVERLEKRGVFLHGNYVGRLGLSAILDRSLELPQKLREAS